MPGGEWQKLPMGDTRGWELPDLLLVFHSLRMVLTFPLVASLPYPPIPCRGTAWVLADSQQVM